MYFESNPNMLFDMKENTFLNLTEKHLLYKQQNQATMKIKYSSQPHYVMAIGV